MTSSTMRPQAAATLKSYTGLRLEIAQNVPRDALRVLDLGCSDGALGAYLAAQNPERTVDGIEYDPDFCAIAATHLHHVHEADLNTTSVGTFVMHESYDCLVFADVLEHLASPEKVLADTLQVLRPGGAAIISTPNIRHVTALWAIFVRGSFPRRDRGIFDKTHLRWFTRRDLIELAKSAGLIDIRVDTNLRLFDPPGGRINRLLHRYSKVIGRLPAFTELLGYQHILFGRKKS